MINLLSPKVTEIIYLCFTEKVMSITLEEILLDDRVYPIPLASRIVALHANTHTNNNTNRNNDIF